MNTIFKSIREEVLAGCDLSFRKGLEKLRLAAHNTRAYWYERSPGSLHFGFFPLRLDRSVSNLGVELTYQRGEGVVVALGGGVPTSDAKLVEQAVRCAENVSTNSLPLWVVLMSVFAVGSTRAHQLARRFGLDPDREVTAHSTECENCTSAENEP